MTAAATKALHALRQFASLGVSFETAVPTLAAILRQVVGFDTWSIAPLNEHMQPVDLYISDEINPLVIARYAEHWLNQAEARFYPSQATMQTDPRYQVVRVSDFCPRFDQTELYDEVFKVHDHSWIAGVALYGPGRQIGNLGLGRPPTARDYSADEMALLAQARPHMIHALSRKPAEGLNLGPTSIEETAMLVCDAAGKIRIQSDNTWRLLRWAAGVGADTPTLNDAAYVWAAPVLAGLVARVEDALRGKGGPVAVKHVRNGYGEFVLRAYAMHDTLGSQVTAFGVQVERHAPLALQMFSQPAFLALTNREQTTCRLVVQGASQSQMAEQMGVKASTVISHVRNLYERLGVTSRNEVAGAVLQAA